MELSDLEIYVLDSALKIAGIKDSELIDYDNLKIASMKEISNAIMEADLTYRY
jgi:hypothetical protein